VIIFLFIQIRIFFSEPPKTRSFLCWPSFCNEFGT